MVTSSHPAQHGKSHGSRDPQRRQASLCRTPSRSALCDVCSLMTPLLPSHLFDKRMDVARMAGNDLSLSSSAYDQTPLLSHHHVSRSPAKAASPASISGLIALQTHGPPLTPVHWTSHPLHVLRYVLSGRPQMHPQGDMARALYCSWC